MKRILNLMVKPFSYDAQLERLRQLMNNTDKCRQLAQWNWYLSLFWTAAFLINVMEALFWGYQDIRWLIMTGILWFSSTLNFTRLQLINLQAEQQANTSGIKTDKRDG